MIRPALLGGMLAVARSGSTRMAVTASLAGPLCQLSMGTGLSMILVRLQGKVIEAHLGMNMKLMMVFGFVAMGYFLVAVPAAHRFVFTRRTAVAMMASYLAFVVAFIVVALEE